MNNKRIQELVSEIKELGGLRSMSGMLKFKALPNVKTTSKEVEKFEKHIGKALPKSLSEFYTEIGPYIFSFAYRDSENPNYTIYGRTVLFELAQMLKHPDPRINLNKQPKYELLLWNKGDSADEINKVQDLFIFDELAFDNFVLIGLTKGKDEPDLYLYTCPHNLARLNLTMEQYVDFSLKARGLYLWQQYFTSTKDMPKLLPDNFHDNHHQLFPTIDSSVFPKADRPYYKYNICILTTKTNYAERFERMVNELKNHKKITNVEFQMNRLNPGAYPADIHRCFLALGFELPESVLKFYQNVNGMSLKWNSVEKDGLECEFVFLSLEDMFAGLDPTGLDWVLRRRWDFNAAKHYGEFGGYEGDISQLEPWRILYREERNNTLIKFNTDGSVELSLMEDYDQYKLKLEFEEFIEKLLEFRGAKYWQCLFIDKDPYKYLGLPADYLQKFRKLFPA